MPFIMDRVVDPVINYFKGFRRNANRSERNLYNIELGEDQTEDHLNIIPLEELTEESSIDAVTTSQSISVRQVIASYAAFIFAKPNRPRIIAASVLTLSGTLLDFLGPYILGTVIQSLNKSINEKDTENDTSNLLGLTSLVVVYWLAQLVRNIREQILVPVTANNTKQILMRITEHQLNKSLNTHINTQQSEFIYLLQKGFLTSSTSTPLLTQIGPALLELSIAITALSYQYGVPMGVGLSTVFSIYIAYCAATTKPIIDSRENMLNKGRELWQELSSAFERYKTIHDCNKLAETMKAMEKAVTEAAEAEVKATTIPLKIGMGHIAIPRLGMLAATLYVGMLVQARQLTVPEFVALFGYSNQLSGTIPLVGDAMNKVFSSYHDLKFVFGALEKSSEIMDKYPNVPLNIEGAPTIRIENLVFGHPKKRTTFNNISLTIKSGQTIALVSESGGGKSTLFNLIYGYYLPVKGNIYINDQDITKVSRTSLREHIGLVEQKPNLFNKSIRDNIKFGSPNPHLVTDEVIFVLAKNLNLAGFICSLANSSEINLESFSQGLDCSVGGGGRALSEGQQQKVAILRGFINDDKRKRIRFLDEVTAALDAESASDVLAGIKKLSANTTTLIITHRLAEIIEVDKIFMLEKGMIAGEGTHAELLQTCPPYQKLWAKQNLHKENDTPSVTSFMGKFHHADKQEEIKQEINNEFENSLKT